MPPEPPAGGSPERLGPEAGRIVAEKVRVLRLLRALDRAGVTPDAIPALRAPLVKLAEGDQMLTLLLEFLDRDPEGSRGLGASLDQLLPVCEAVRGDVLDALDGRDQAAVRRTAGEVAATEAEVWLEVEGLRRRTPPPKAQRGGPRSAAQSRAEAERSLASGRLPRQAGVAQVAEQERRPLPPDSASLVTWLASLPPGWLRAMARLHEVPVPGEATALAGALAARLADAAWLKTYVAERIGASEREVLVTVLAVGEAPLVSSTAELHRALAVHWDWEGGIPAAAGGRLRAAGFVHVGQRAGRSIATVPPPLRASLTAALEAADPSTAALPDRARRGAMAQALQGVPHADPELDRWKAHERALSKRLEEWAIASPRDDRAMQAFFGPGPRVLRTEGESSALLEFLVLDWRSEPGAPSFAERQLAKEGFKNPERQALAQAILASHPVLYRVEAVRRGADLTFTPLFPAGTPIVVTDRAASLTSEVGWVFGARLYPAGRFTLCRYVGEPLPASEERRVLRHLRRAQEAHAKATGRSAAEAAFVAAEPQVIAQAVRACAPAGWGVNE